MTTVEELSSQALPAALKALQESSRSLAKLSSDIRDMNERAPDKKKALEDTKQYAFQALASVAYQVNVLSQNINQFMDLQMGELEGTLADVHAMSQQIAASHEYTGRKAIGDMNVVAVNPFPAKAIKLSEPQIFIEDRSNQRLDLSALDHIGLGRSDGGRPLPSSAPQMATPKPAVPSTPIPVDPSMDDQRGRASSSVLAFKNRVTARPTAPIGTTMMGIPTMDLPSSALYSDAPPPPPPPPPQPDTQAPDAELPSVQAMYDYVAQTEEEISITAGDILRVTNPDVGDGWMEGKTITGETGIFPASYVSAI